MANTALENIKVRINQTNNVKVRVQDDGSLQSQPPVTIKNNTVGNGRFLTDLLDVTITDASNSQILAYLANTGSFENRNPTSLTGNSFQIAVANNNAFDFNLSLSNTVVINQSLTVNTQFSTNSTGTYINNGFFGNVNISNATILTGTLQLQNIIPDANNVYTIGNNTNRFATLYLSGNTLYMGNVVFTDTNTSLSLTSSNGSPIAVSMGNAAVNGSLSVSTSFSANSLSANTLTINQTSNLAGNTTVGGDLNITGSINRNPNINLVLTGDISGSGNATLTNLGSVTITVNTIAQGNSVELGVDTTGSYVASLANGTGVFISNTSSGESEVPVIAIGQDVQTNSTVTFASANVTGNVVVGNSALFVDAANNKVGINTNTPEFDFQIVTERDPGGIILDTYTTTGAPNVKMRRARGSKATPAPVQLNDNLGTINGTGYVDGLGFPSLSKVAIQMFSTEAHTNTGMGTRIVFSTTNTASNTRSDRFVVGGNATVNTAITAFDIIGFRANAYFDQTIFVGANLTLNTSSISIGNSIANTFANSTTIVVSRISATNVATTNLQVTDTIAGNNMTLSGNLTVSGTTTYINTTALNVGDNIITLNADVTNVTAPTENAGIEINRGSSANVSFLWDETLDTWSQGNTTVAGYVNASSINVTGSATVNGALTVNNIASFGNTTITGFVNATSVNVTEAATVNGALIVNNTASFGNTTITGFANVVGNVNVTNILTSANLFANTLSTNNFLTNEIAVITSAGNATIAPTIGIAGWNYSGKFKSVAGEESAPTGLFISPDGLNMYVNGTTGDDVNQYTLSAAWDISTASYLRVFSTASQDSAPNDIFFKPDGLSMFILGQTNDRVFQYTLSTAWDISTATYASKFFSVTSQEATPLGLWFKSDGTAMYVVGSTADTVFQYTLGTAWDVSTASYASISFSVTAQDSAPAQVSLSADGFKMWVLGNTGDDISEYALGTAWNVSTATFVNNFYIGFQDNNAQGLFVDSTGDNRVYVLGATTDIVYQYNTATNSISANTNVFNTTGNARVQGDLAVQGRSYVDGAFIVQGNITNAGTATLGGLTNGGTTTLATSTSTQTVALGAGATASGSTKTMNIGIAGVSGSITNLNLGSAVSGATTNTLLYSNTFIVTGGNTHLGGLIGGESLRVISVANSNNYLQVAAAVTGSAPILSAQGVDTDIGIDITGKGTGVVNISPSINVPGSATVNGAFVVNNTASFGNTTVTGFVNATASVNSAILSVGTAFIANSTGITTTGFANVGTTVSVGANVIANTTALFLGNSTVNAVMTANSLNISDASGNVISISNSGVDIVQQDAGTGFRLSRVAMGATQALRFTTNSGGHFVNAVSTAANPKILRTNVSASGNVTNDTFASIAIESTDKFKANSTLVSLLANTTVTGDFTTTGFANVATTVSVGANVIANTTVLFIGNSTVNATHSSSLLQVANSTSTTNVSANGVYVGGSYINSSAVVSTNTVIASAGLDGQVAITDSINGGIELGKIGRTSSGTPYIDFHSSASSPDYDVRIIASGGNTTSGSGNLAIFANTLNLPNTSITGFANVSTTLNVTGAATVNGALTVNNTASVGNTTVTGFINVSSTANVGGILSARSDVTVNGTLTVANTASLGNTTITGFANVSGNLQVNNVFATGSVQIDGNLIVNGNTVSINVTDLKLTDNLIFLNEPEVDTITSATSNGTAFIYTANNGLAVGMTVTITGIDPAGYNVTANTITFANLTHFAVANTTSPGAYVSGGTSEGRSGVNPDLGFTGEYNDGTVRHAGFFRDATDGVFKVFDQYQPEPNGAFIDTSNNTFRIADFQSNNTLLGTANVAGTTRIGTGLANYIQIAGSTTGNWTTLSTQGSDTNIDISYFTKGSGNHTFSSGGVNNNIQFRVAHTASAVNYLQATGAATGSGPTLIAAGTDTNIDFNVTAKGTAYVNIGTTNGVGLKIQDRASATRPIVIRPGATGVAAPSITVESDLSSQGIDFIAKNAGTNRFIAAGQVQFQVSSTTSAVNYIDATGAATGTRPTISVQGTDTNIGLSLTTKGTGEFNFNTGSAIGFNVYSLGSAPVNYWSAAPNDAGGTPYLYAQGSDTNVSGSFSSKGTGSLFFRTNGGNQTQFLVTHTASAVNYITATGAATGSSPTLTAQGSDTNVAIGISSKGTGGVLLRTSGVTQLAVTHTASSVNFVNITGSTTGSGPSVSADGSDTDVALRLLSKNAGAIRHITGGGEQFRVTNTASAVNYINATGAATGAAPVLSVAGTDTNIDVIIAAKGTGNVVSNNNFTVVQTSNTTLKVWANTATTPVADLELQRGQTATWGGDTFTDYRIRASGGNFILQSQNNATSVLDLLTVDEASNTIRLAPAGVEQFRVVQTASAVNYIQVAGAVTTGAPYVLANGSDTNIPLILSSKGTGSIQFKTAGATPTQFLVAHTASAVNYVQVTGAATTASPVISVQGSDTNISTDINTKGSGAFNFRSYGGSNRQFRIDGSPVSVNYVQVAGAVTGSAVEISAQGTDTNIDIALTPKGTGVVHSTTPLQVETDTVITTKTLTTTATTADQVVASFAGATYRSTQFIIQATDATGSKYQKTTILAVHNGTTAEHTEFGNINLGGDCGTFNVSYSGGNMVLTVTPASTNSTVFKVTCILTKV